MLILLVLSSFCLAEQQFPDQLINLQDSYSGEPDLVVESFNINPFNAEVSLSDGSTHFYTSPLLDTAVTIRNQGDGTAVGNFRVEIFSDAEGRDKKRTVGLYDIIKREAEGVIQLVPLTVYSAEGVAYQDYPKALDIFTGEVSVVDSTEKLKQSMEKGSIFFYELKAGEWFRYSSGATENQVPIYFPPGLLSTWLSLEPGIRTFRAQVTGVVSESNIINNELEVNFNYQPVYHKAGPYSGNQQIPYLTEKEIFVFSRKGKCLPAELVDINLDVCLEDAGWFHADFSINSVDINFGFFGKWFKFSETSNIEGNQIQSTVYGNGIKLKLVE